MSKIRAVFLTAVVGLLLAACSQTLPSEPHTSASRPTTAPKGPVRIPADALDKTLPDGVTGPKIDIRQYKPMPLPVQKEEPAARIFKPEGDVVSYNLKTGVERRLEGLSIETLAAMPEAASTPGNPGSNGRADGGTLGALGYGSLSKIWDTTTWPARSNVKIFQRFPNGEKIVCSGQLYDPKWVITAGHCVYNKERGGYASEVIVVPGYQSTPNSTYPDDFFDQPWGAAKAVWSNTYSDWRNNEDYDHDIGWLELDRPIGWLSGYAGFGYNSNCSVYTSSWFSNYSFPAATPYNGQQMYYRSGDFDSCETNSSGWYGYEVGFNQLSYGGQSGSTFTRGGGILAVLSSSNIDPNDPDKVTYAPRLTSGKYNNMLTWRDDKKPDTADLVAMNVNTDTSTYKVGDTINLGFQVYNYSEGQYYDYFGYYVYLSTNDTISPGDTELLYHGFNNAPTVIPAGQESRPWVPPTLKMPTCLPNGSDFYYLGIITYNWNWFGDSDAIEGNNRTQNNDTQEVYVSGPKCS